MKHIKLYEEFVNEGSFYDGMSTEAIKIYDNIKSLIDLHKGPINSYKSLNDYLKKDKEFNTLDRSDKLKLERGLNWQITFAEEMER